MMLAATHFDPVVGIDIHIVQPSGPVPPLPIPHPYFGIVFDPADYLPIIGSTVKINGMHRAIAGTAGKELPRHFPIGGTFVPPLPANEHENFMGSSIVEMDGDAAAYMALPCLSCQSIGFPPPPRRNRKKKTKIKSLVLPTSVVLPIPKGAAVLIGGSPTISLTSVASHLVGPLGRAIGRSKAFRKVAGAFKKGRPSTFRNLKPGFLKCKILRAEPVDVVTGEVVVDQQDFELPGRIPIRWTRHYRSDSTRRGICGVGWETPADARLEILAGGVVFHDGTGVATYFDALPDAEPIMEPVDGGRLYRLDRHYAVELKGGLTHYFELPAAPAAELPVAAIVDRCRNSLHFVRDRDGLREVVESAGRRLICSSEQGLLRSIALHHPDFPERPTLVRFAYDGDDNLTAVYDALDHPYTFGWDERHRLVRHTNRTGLSFHYEYDTESRCVHSWGDGGLYDYHFEYDPVRRFTNLTDSLGHPWTVEYDERHLITRETDPLGGVTSYAYDEVGRTTAIVDPIGHTTAYEYDERGNLVKLTRADGSTITCEYDRNDRPVRMTDPNGEVWEQRWDERGLLVERSSPLGALARYAYDDRGQVTCFINPRGAITRVACDAFDNLTALTDALGNVTRFQHDGLGNVTARVDPLGHVISSLHDIKGRLTKAVLPGGAAIKFDYDADDNLICFVDENGAVTRFDYCGLGQLKRRIQPDGLYVEYEYDAEERLSAVTNQRSETCSVRRDALGRIIEERDYWDQSRRYAYDAAGRIWQSVDPLGRIIHYKTDPLGRIRRKVLPLPGRPSKTFEEGFEFDANGNLVRITSPHAIVTRRFDAEGRLLEEVQGDFAITNTYDPNGNRLRRETSAGNMVTYEYDALDRVSVIRINHGPPILMHRDQRGQINHESFGRGLIRQYCYDAAGRQTAQAIARNGKALFSVSFDYDAVGNLIRRSDSHYGIHSYRYDCLGRVLVHTDPQGRLARFLYDPAGDRLETRARAGEEAGPAAVETASEADRWAREGNYDATRYRFDRAGNLVFSSGEDTNVDRRDAKKWAVRFTWDANQRLFQSETNGVLTRYGYDPLGRRVFKETNAKRTSFYWDGDALLAEDVCDVSDLTTTENDAYKASTVTLSAPVQAFRAVDPAKCSTGAADPSGRFTRSREYLHYPETFEPLALIEKSESQTDTYYYHIDPNGCPTRLTGQTGEVVWSASYDASGAVVTLHDKELSNPMRLQGQYEDPETRLYYNRYRYYDPSIGQFVGQDPLRLRPSDNVYEFAPNIFRWADPLGLARQPRQPGHRVLFSWARPSTGEYEIGDEFSGLGPGAKYPANAPIKNPQVQLDTHTERWVMLQLEDRLQEDDVITILGTKDPCPPRGTGCNAVMNEFAKHHDIKIIYVNTETGKVWRYPDRRIQRKSC
jgi:RHS repeat-associated protein